LWLITSTHDVAQNPKTWLEAATLFVRRAMLVPGNIAARNDLVLRHFAVAINMHPHDILDFVDTFVAPSVSRQHALNWSQKKTPSSQLPHHLFFSFLVFLLKSAFAILATCHLRFNLFLSMPDSLLAFTYWLGVVAVGVSFQLLSAFSLVRGVINAAGVINPDGLDTEEVVPFEKWSKKARKKKQARKKAKILHRD
jgi:hypothetical protein